MIKKILLLGSFLGVLAFNSCSSDDDNSKVLTIEEQNEADDIAINNFLDNYYFNDLGRIEKFSEKITSNEKDPLRKNAEKDPSGFWIVRNPEAETGSGDHPNGENNIFIHYDLKYFTASTDGAGFSSINTAFSTIDGAGKAQENPVFYKKPANDTHSDNYYVVPSLISGLSKFLPTNKNEEEVFNKLQGVIIVPSRLAYARNSNWLNTTNATLILNFELYKVSSN